MVISEKNALSPSNEPEFSGIEVERALRWGAPAVCAAQGDEAGARMLRAMFGIFPSPHVAAEAIRASTQFTPEAKAALDTFLGLLKL